jgi:hypothetical protein
MAFEKHQQTATTTDDLFAALGTPSLDRLESLVESITSAGVPTRIVPRGRPRSLPTEVDRAAERFRSANTSVSASCPSSAYVGSLPLSFM